jgi:hypothetical protein
LSLRVYPWSLHAQRVDRGASAHEAYVSSWRYVIAAQLSCLALREDRVRLHDDARKLETFLVDNYGGISPDLDSILRPKSLKLSKVSFKPTVLGNSLCAIDLERGNRDLQFGLELNALSDAIIESVKTLVRVFDLPRVMIHFD